MKHFTLFSSNSHHSIRLRFMARIAVGVIGTALLTTLASCGGSSPEPKTIELYMQSQGFYPGEAGGSCAFNAPMYSSNQRWFQEEILQKQLNLTVISSGCRYRPDIKPVSQIVGVVSEICLAEYRFEILAKGAVQSREDIPIIFRDANDYYTQSGTSEIFGLFAWGRENVNLQGSAIEVPFPPKFTASYVDCGG